MTTLLGFPINRRAGLHGRACVVGFVLALMLLVAMGAGHPAYGQANLLVNPSCEIPPDNPPSGWTEVGTTAFECILASSLGSTAHEGTDIFFQNSTQVVTRSMTQDVAVSLPGTGNYMAYFSAWTLDDFGEGDRIQYQVNFLNASDVDQGGSIDSGLFTPGSVGVYEEFEAFATVPATTTTLRVTVTTEHIGGGNGFHDFVWDDLFLAVFGPRTISGDAGWRMLSLPITGGALDDIVDDTDIQGIAGGANTGSEANAFFYPSTGVWTEPASLGAGFGDGHGFILYFFDTSQQGTGTPLPTDLNAGGSQPGADVNVTLNPGGFILAGNPWQVNLDLDALTGNGTGGVSSGLVSPIQVWNDAVGDPNAGDACDAANAAGCGTYTSFNFGSGEGNIAAHWQGFMLESGNATTLTIPTASQTGRPEPTVSVFSKRGVETRTVKLELEGPNGAVDRATQLYFHPAATNTPARDGWDGTKLTPLQAAFNTLAFRHEGPGGTRLLVQDARPYEPTTVQVYALDFTSAGIAGDFTISWPMWGNIPETWTLTLHDLDTGASVDMRTATGYTFAAAATTAAQTAKRFSQPEAALAAMAAGPRFEIVVNPSLITAVEDETLPTGFALEQNYPNPFNPATTIAYMLPTATPVRLTVLDGLGREVAVLADGFQPAGRHALRWDATGQASGLFLYRLDAGGITTTRRMLLVK